MDLGYDIMAVYVTNDYAQVPPPNETYFTHMNDKYIKWNKNKTIKLKVPSHYVNFSLII